MAPAADHELSKRPGTRKRFSARMLALQALCAYDAVGVRFDDHLNAFLQDPETHADLGLETPLAGDVLRFARELVHGVRTSIQRVDALIAPAAEHWALSRMTPVDRNILRLGTCELLAGDPERPAQVVINEAVELARKFGDRNSPAFVNGVLDAIHRGEAGSPPVNGSDPAPADGM